MDAKEIVDQLSEEEIKLFLESDCGECYQFVTASSQYASILEKTHKNERLSDKEWEYILFRLYLISCKAVAEEDSVDFMDHVFSFMSRIGMLISAEGQRLYNECYKMVQFVDSIRKERDINKDLMISFYDTLDNQKEEKLDLLLQQQEDAYIFHRNRQAFMQSYKEASLGDMSVDERMYLNACHNAYDREKRLMKRRKES